MKAYFTMVILACLIITSGITSAHALVTSAASAIVLEAGSGRVIYESNADQKRLIASTTKIMTGILTVEMAKMDDIVKITAPMTGVEGSSMYLKEGQERSVSQLLHGLLLQSGNDAAVALAIHCSGSVESFVNKMNAKAKELGMENTSFANPHGLNAEGHYSSARDLGKLAAYAMKNPAFSAVTSKKFANVGEISVKNHNKMLWIYDGANGVKTGYTIDAGRCLVSSAAKNGQLFIAVTLNAPDDWRDHSTMLDYAFLNYPHQLTWKDNDAIIAQLPVFNGTKSDVTLVLSDSINLTLSKEEFDSLKIETVYPHYLWAPIEAGSVVGKLTVTLNGKIIGFADLKVSESIEPLPVKKRKSRKYE